MKKGFIFSMDAFFALLAVLMAISAIALIQAGNLDARSIQKSIELKADDDALAGFYNGTLQTDLVPALDNAKCANYFHYKFRAGGPTGTSGSQAVIKNRACEGA